LTIQAIQAKLQVSKRRRNP